MDDLIDVDHSFDCLGLLTKLESFLGFMVARLDLVDRAQNGGLRVALKGVLKNPSQL